MANVFFAFPNFADLGYYAPVLSGGSWQASLPLSNMQDPLLSKVARSTDVALASTCFHVDLGFYRDARCICIPKHAMGRYARIRARAAAMPAFVGVRLAAAATMGDTSLTLKCPTASASLRTGQTFSLPGDDTVYTLQSPASFGRNVFPDGNDFTPAYWAASNATATAASASGPDETTTASTLVENTAAGVTHTHTATLASVPLAGLTGTYTVSLFVKPIGSRNLRLEFQRTGNTWRAEFNLQTGAVHSSAATAGTPSLRDIGIEPAANGYYRCWVTLDDNALAQPASAAVLTLLDATLQPTYTGDGASGLSLWGFCVLPGLNELYYSEGGAGTAAVTVSPALAANHADDEPLTARCGEYVGQALALDTGWKKVFPVIYPALTTAPPWGNPSVWDGKIAEEDRADYPSPWLHISELPVLARYWYVEIDDRLNNAGYVDVARLFIARGLQPSRNFQYGAQIVWQHETQERKTLGGAVFYDRRPPRRTLTLQVSYLPEDEALTGFLDMFRELGRDGQLFVSLDPDASAQAGRKSFLATMATDGGLDFTAFNLLSTTTMQFNEVIA